MRIGIIGAGKIGTTLAHLFTDAGHDVAIANSRGPDTLRDLENELGAQGHAATSDEAAARNARSPAARTRCRPDDSAPATECFYLILGSRRRNNFCPSIFAK